MLKSIDTKVEDKGIDESKVRQGRLHAGTGRCESTASLVPVHSAGRRAIDLENGPQPQRKPPIEAAQIMNVCDMCSECCQGVPTAACRLRNSCRGGNLSSACTRKERGSSWRSNPPRPAFILGSNLALVCQTGVGAVVGRRDLNA